MKRDGNVWMMGLYWIPFALGLGSVCAYLFFLSKRWPNIDLGMAVTSALGIIVGFIAVAMALFAASDSRTLTSVREKGAVLEQDLAQARAHVKKLSSHLEVLTAMREVTRILSDAVDFKQIAENVFAVLEPLLGTREIALVLRDDNDELILKALRRDGQTLYEDDLTGSEIDITEAAGVIEHQTLVREVDGTTAVFSVPLIADQIAVGVMRFEVELEGSHDEREVRIEEFESVLGDIAKHLALVVKTPSLHDRAIIDGLTGLFTRRHFDIRIDDMFRLARRYATPFALILMDLDYFKQVNDTHGHRAGDVVLRETAGLVTGGIRDCDSAFRYGGEEFAVLLPETPAEHARAIAERLRKAVGGNQMETDNGDDVAVTISMGVAEYGPALANYGELIALADQALYYAKKGGRDRTVTSEEMADTPEA
jgi:diguanylate cyclase (GGDEF)-like protein